MLERSEDSLISRLLLFLWLPLAALVGIVPLEDEHPVSLALSGEAGISLADSGVSSLLFDLPPPELVVPARSVPYPMWASSPFLVPFASIRLPQPILSRASYVQLLRHQLLRIPDSPEA